LAKIDILQMGPYPSWDIELLQKSFQLHPYFEADDKAAFIAERADAIRGIATRGELGASRELIDALPHLEVISVYGVGYDAVDLDAAKARGIRVTNTPDVLTKDVADLGIAMMLAGARGVIGAEQWVRSGNWGNQGLYPLQTQVSGKRVGILGLGRIGYEVAKRCAAFDMEIAYSDLGPRDFAKEWTYIEDPAELAAQADFFFVTLTGGPATRHIVSAAVIKAVGPQGMIINISRASNIDEAALLKALEDRSLGYAALDVFEGEPQLDPRFLALDNVLLQPHHASGTIETRKAMGRLVCENLEAHFAGRPLPTPVI